MSNHDGLLIDARKFAEDLAKRGNDWADKDAAYRALEETQKTVLSEAFLEAGEGSIAEREAKARVSPKYREHIERMATAKKEANRAKVSYDTMQIYVDLQRTNAAAQRALVNLQ